MRSPVLEARQSLEIHDSITELEIAKLDGPSWLLRPLDPALVSELATSIENAGLLQPIVVRPRGRSYEVVFGNHRLEACRRLGKKRISAVISHLTDEEAFLARISENLLRNSKIDPVEEAKGYRLLIKRGWTIHAIARKIGKCDSYVSERIALLDRLSGAILSKVCNGNGHLTPSHAEVLSRIKDVERQNEVAELVERKRLSVRALENMLNRAPAPRKVHVEVTAGEYWLNVPREFAEAMKLDRNQVMYLYIQGRKMILENIHSTRRRASWRKPGLLASVENFARAK